MPDTSSVAIPESDWSELSTGGIAAAVDEASAKVQYQSSRSIGMPSIRTQSM